MMLRIIGYARMKVERRARWDPLWRPVDKFLQRIDDIYWSVRGYRTVECLGDSHVAAFRRINFTYPEVAYRFRTTSVLGATAYGIGKVQSSTNARDKFEKRLEQLNGKTTVLVCLGEVDATFLVWFLAEKKSVDVETMFAVSLRRYQEFLQAIKLKVKELIVCSAPLPTIKDGQKHPRGLMLRDSIDVPYKEQTKMVLRFNNSIREYCKCNKIAFLDLDASAINPKTSLLDERFVRQDRYDNHYIEQEYIKIILPQFEKLATFLKWKI